MPQPRDWVERVNSPMTIRELERLRTSVSRNRPFGDEHWTTRTARRMGLTHTLRSVGRPPKAKK